MSEGVATYEGLDDPLFHQVGIIGLGLIGASLAQAIFDRRLATSIVAIDTNQASIEAGISCGLLTDGGLSIQSDADKLANCDLIVVAVPVKAVPMVFEQLADAISKGEILSNCLITDVGSTKQTIVTAYREAFAKFPTVYASNLPHFVPAHPIAGAEKSGFNARRGDLFHQHKVIVCPLPESSAKAVQQVSALWRGVGAEVMTMDADHHDRVLAHTSHLPHLLAFTLVEQLASHNDNMDIFRYAAGGFRDFTRIAASDPTMWHDIFYANEAAILTALDDFESQLDHLRQLILRKDSTALLGMLGRVQSARQHFGHMLTATPYSQPLHSTQANHSKNSHSSEPHSEVYMSDQSLNFIINPTETPIRLQGSISVPGDKSVSHRSIMFGSLANGVTKVTGFLEGEDALATLQAFKDMGVTIEGPKDGEVIIHGVGMHGLKPSPNPLYMGNSGTSMRLLAGILSAQAFDSVMTGDASLSKRPMERVAKPLREMGAVIQTTGEKGTAPISITGRDKTGKALHGITYAMPVASAQVKSCLLLAGLWADGDTVITQPEITRDHTERMLNAFGLDVKTEGNTIRLTGGEQLTACDIAVPADISSAAFFMVAASIAHDSELTLKQVGINPTRTGVIDILKLMGADITLSNEKSIGGEPVADITVKSAQLHGSNIPPELVPLAIDEFPALFVAASCATGRTTLTGAKELRVKESDRIAVMATGLQTLGIDCTVLDDGIIIEGKGKEEEANTSSIFTGGVIDTHHDHRIAMSFAMASLRASKQIVIRGVETVNTSFPNFAGLANQIGMNIQVL